MSLLTNFSVAAWQHENPSSKFALDPATKLVAGKIASGVFQAVAPVCKSSFHPKLALACEFIGLQFLSDYELSISEFSVQNGVSETELIAIQRRALSEVGFDVYQFSQ
ncbi:hypothetical protein SS50377_27104 [Spironucleus salmonicida]|nr:hypothetical protein SS50377_27101 [Spironucleus salmonicida]KAH0570813.1 hypothetical protein SS50377_27104 [Spironucleus salmonicida]